ncbi:MFS monocarboxylate transporter [Penicillium canescens]|uniref:MFS monocarboxylate transporter n=1 Tax=Penicillium canescens TaxID=5083 RepID=A0AAD6INJ9_PENCN|nr:MFS monocarboxylate transporter [Penicillium canescens]KAJ6019606.1 MFS monocarboxylate transporter [Penicillium canescens]KAJ6033159.1 MFS monocarboxylate transporter [Penicillium canescens]KAJ6057653.1 MFS monocarboxylate transporter [Penicillium canescens]KAJ6058967.1 MFS monocarboxylate transporter [Penicillium canescens]
MGTRLLQKPSTSEMIIQEAESPPGRSLRGDLDPPPDGGFHAWLQVALCHLAVFNTWGYINSFGLFQTYYTTFMSRSASDISWIGSIQIFCLFGGGMISGRLTDAGHFKPLFALGTLFQLVGIFTASFATQYYQILLSQGLCIGIGNGFIFCPALTVVSSYFKTRRGLAIGVAVSGSGTGGIIFPAIANATLSSMGFGWTLRILGFITLATHIPCLLFFRTRLPPRASGPLIALSMFKDVPYAFFNISMFFNFLGLYFTFFYLGNFARNIIHTSTSISTNLLMILNGVGILGRLLPSFVADKYVGLLNSIIPVNMLTCVLMYSWAGVHSVGGLYAFVVIYGFFAAGVQSMFPAVLSTLTTDPTTIGTRMGMTFAVVGISCLIGLPLSGQMIAANSKGQFLYAQMAAGTFLLTGTAFMIAARVSITGVKWKVKV